MTKKNTFFLATSVFLLDQGTKLLVHAYPNAFKSLLSPLISFAPEKNAVAALSLPISNYVLLAGGIVIILSLLRIYSPTYQRGVRGGLSVLIAGGASNLFDRLVLGSVREIARLGSLTFNLADVAIIIASVWILANILARKHSESSLAA